MPLSYKIVLNQEAFNKASIDLAELAKEFDVLNSEITTLLEGLKTGWDTPSGKLFISFCEGPLTDQLNGQKLVIEKISRTLSMSKTEYESVFTSYEILNNSIHT